MADFREASSSPTLLPSDLLADALAVPSTETSDNPDSNDEHNLGSPTGGEGGNMRKDSQVFGYHGMLSSVEGDQEHHQPPWDLSHYSRKGKESEVSSHAFPTIANVSRFLRLPPELVDTILSHVSPYDLVALSSTCRELRKHALSNVHWYDHVQQNIPGITLTTPAPCSSYHELYAAHDRLWFLPKYKLWFCDRDLMGKLIIVRYDPRRGCIEGYQLLAERRGTTHELWEADSHVVIHGFEPRVKLHLDKPVLQFRVQKSDAQRQFSEREGANWYADELPMELDDRLEAVFSNFLLTRPLDSDVADEKLAAGYPYGKVWPPRAIPARHHVSAVRSIVDLPELDPEDHPRRRSEVSDQAFRVRQWMEMAGSPGAPRLVRGRPWDITAAAVMPVLTGIQPMGAIAGTMSGVHIGEELITYSTIDPVFYTPTTLKPWRGIWVGDYSGHGCEFLLINQPDDPPATDAELGLVRNETETDEQWESRRSNGHVYRGRLEAIKLTGDPNVPRGEYTFIAEDLGPCGYVADATHPPFAGARVVRSKGHVADTGFVDDRYMECELLLLSHNRLAQYWVGFGHISYFERVEVDSFLVP
ncbi:Fc.00g053830.m01.CDS01 [Cosmosporella sp. VM-42]